MERLIGAPVAAVDADIRDGAAMSRIFAENSFDAVVHFAALKSVAESVARPLDYFDNNIGGSVSLLKAMSQARVRSLVYSSSAAVYGDADQVPVREDAPLRASSPYGYTKIAVERLIDDVCVSDQNFLAAKLRYFNPVGAHPSGLIGEDPRGVPDNLMPLISQVAYGRRETLNVFGGDYPTHDGSGVRDYLHVMDLARAHADALDYLQREKRSLEVNLGSGRGISVLELIRAFERASGRRVPFEVVSRRAGDVASLYADPGLARTLLGWHAELDIEAMCQDSWRWQVNNPTGYPEPSELAGP
jgi:UDP-glucose 4-epimerase